MGSHAAACFLLLSWVPVQTNCTCASCAWSGTYVCYAGLAQHNEPRECPAPPGNCSDGHAAWSVRGTLPLHIQLVLPGGCMGRTRAALRAGSAVIQAHCHHQSRWIHLIGMRDHACPTCFLGCTVIATSAEVLVASVLPINQQHPAHLVFLLQVSHGCILHALAYLLLTLCRSMCLLTRIHGAFGDKFAPSIWISNGTRASLPSEDLDCSADSRVQMCSNMSYCPLLSVHPLHLKQLVSSCTGLCNG